MDARATLLVSQLAETLRDFANRLDALVGHDRALTPDDFREPEAERKRPACSRCGFVGGNARGCGKATGHPTQSPRAA